MYAAKEGYMRFINSLEYLLDDIEDIVFRWAEILFEIACFAAVWYVVHTHFQNIVSFCSAILQAALHAWLPVSTAMWNFFSWLSI